ncbi:MAG: hypothetical protein CVT72_15810 [Alphaproteobacteria bacterium HGW-Alphaproteobacteria-11]|nr:MAG: hypothetical protein CVT72_15810 [Alphaproteobacteria bacterium HGW-Alphaproteobacteria-11]
MRGAIRTAFVILTLATGIGTAHAEPASGRAVEWVSGKDVFAAAEELTIDRRVDGALTAAGQIVILTRDAHVKGDAWIAARRAAIEGELEGDLSIRGQEALINGHVKGDVTFYGVELSLGPDARIDGDVDYYSASTARIDKGAVVKGEVNGNAFRIGGDTVARDDTRERWRDSHMRERGGGLSAPGYHMSAGGAVVFGGLALLLGLIAPGAAGRMRDAVVAEPWQALGLGFVWLVGVPVLAVATAITLVGLPVAFLLMLLYPLGIVFGLVAALTALGGLIAARIGSAGEGALGLVVGIVLAATLLWLAISIPVLGAIVWLAAVAAGLGLVVMALWGPERAAS